jgi:hypothetical protein
MNTLEDRLRAALHAHAEDFSAQPDAWQQLNAKSLAGSGPRRVSRRSWPARFGIPAAAAAAVIAIVAGAAALTGGGPPSGSGASGSSSASPSVSGAPTPPSWLGGFTKQYPPLSAVVPVKVTVGGQASWTWVWSGRMKSHPGEGIQLCSATIGVNYGGGGCQPENVLAHQVALFPVDFGAIRIGISIRQVTSVTAQLPGGRKVPGMVASGRGFPYHVWAVSYPSADNAQILFRNRGGVEIGHLSVAGVDYSRPSKPRSGGIKLFGYPAGSLGPTAGTMTAYLLGGRLVGFWGSDIGPLLASVPVNGSQAIVNVGSTRLSGATVVEYFGCADQNVARVVLRLPDGRQYGAQTTAAWPGSGVRLWHFAVPAKAASFEPTRQVMLGYNAAGQIVWQKSLGESS